MRVRGKMGGGLLRMMAVVGNSIFGKVIVVVGLIEKELECM